VPHPSWVTPGAYKPEELQDLIDELTGTISSTSGDLKDHLRKVIDALQQILEEQKRQRATPQEVPGPSYPPIGISPETERINTGVR
ncbi:MAG: hypothetical protein ACTSVF_01265, partial [Candidatus Asgardarchaeia archaeon]